MALPNSGSTRSVDVIISLIASYVFPDRIIYKRLEVGSLSTYFLVAGQDEYGVCAKSGRKCPIAQIGIVFPEPAANIRGPLARKG